MSTRRRFPFFSRDNQQQPQPAPASPPATPQPARIPNLGPTEEWNMTNEDLKQSVESLELVLRSMNDVRDQTNLYNAALREHAKSIRSYAVSIQMINTWEETRQRGNVGDAKVSERLLVHCANYYDRLAEAQEQLARELLEEYNILNNYAGLHFKHLAQDSQKLDDKLKDLTKKLSKLTHRQAPPGTANTLNASTVQNAGPHEIYVQSLTHISGQIQHVRQNHLVAYTREQKKVDRAVARSFARCCRQSYNFLANALSKTGSTEAMGGVTAWGVFANSGMPPIADFDEDAEDIREADQWEPNPEDGEEALSARQIAQMQAPRPPSRMAGSIMGMTSLPGTSYPPTNLNIQGSVAPNQPMYNPYPGSSQSQQAGNTSRIVSPPPPPPPPQGGMPGNGYVGGNASQFQQYGSLPDGGAGGATNNSHFHENLSQ